jgi:hypothetical protein
MSLELCVCSNPSSPESHVAIEGISFVLVHVQNKTAPISAGLRPAFSSARLAAIRAISSNGSSVYRLCSIPVFSEISAAFIRDQQ